MKKFFAPSYNVNKMREEVLPNPNLLCKAFKERVYEYYLNPAKKLAAFAQGVLCFTLIDFLAKIIITDINQIKDYREFFKVNFNKNSQESSTTSKVARVALMTLSIFGMLTGVGGIFGGMGSLGITTLSAFLIDNGGSFIDFFRAQQEQLGIDEDPLQDASQVAVSGLPQIPSYNIKLSHISDYIKNMKNLFDVSATQKQDSHKNLREALTDLNIKTGSRFPSMLGEMGPRFYYDESNAMGDRPRNDWRGLVGWDPSLPSLGAPKKISSDYTKAVDYLKQKLLDYQLIDINSRNEMSRFLGIQEAYIRDRLYYIKTGKEKGKNFLSNIYNKLVTKVKTVNLKQLQSASFNVFSWKKAVDSLFAHSYGIGKVLPRGYYSDVGSLTVREQYFASVRNILQQKFYGIVITDTDLSRLLYRDPKHIKNSILKANRKGSFLELSSLYQMRFNLLEHTDQTFADSLRGIDSVDVAVFEQLRRELLAYIDKFIFTNAFKASTGDLYIYDQHPLGTEFYRSEYELTWAVWYEYAKIHGPTHEIKKIRKLIGVDSFGRLTNKYGHSWDGAMSILNGIRGTISSNAYSRLFPKVWSYIEEKGLTPALPREYTRLWYSKEMTRYHLTVLLLRDLCFNPKLNSLSPESFQKRTDRISADESTAITFLRHHMRPNDKLNNDPNYLELTTFGEHGDLEGIFELLLNLRKARLKGDLECPDVYKDFIGGDAINRWNEYQEAIRQVDRVGIEEYLREKLRDENGQNYFIDRWYPNSNDGQLVQNMKDVIMNMVRKGMPFPVLHPVVLNQLFGDNAEAITKYIAETNYLGSI